MRENAREAIRDIIPGGPKDQTRNLAIGERASQLRDSRFARFTHAPE